MKEQIQNFIGNNKIKQAIDYLIENLTDPDDKNSAVLLSSRLTGLNQNEMRGILSQSEISLERNKIVAAIFNLAGFSSDEDDNTQPNKNINQNNPNMEKTLLNIIKENERSNPEVAEEAANFLKVLRNHNDRKSTDVYYDISNRRGADLQVEYNAFLKKISENKKDSLEDFILKVKDLLIERVPSYENIEKAYALCVGRGFKSQSVKDTLTLKPDDKNAKFNIIDEIETFLLTFK